MSVEEELSHLTVEVVSPSGVIWAGDARGLSAPAADGRLGVLPGHQSLLCTLRPGYVAVEPIEGDPFRITVPGGFMSLDADVLTLLADDPQDGR